jgi:hypothetical protein
MPPVAETLRSAISHMTTPRPATAIPPWRAITCPSNCSCHSPGDTGGFAGVRSVDASKGRSTAPCVMPAGIGQASTPARSRAVIGSLVPTPRRACGIAPCRCFSHARGIPGVASAPPRWRRARSRLVPPVGSKRIICAPAAAAGIAASTTPRAISGSMSRGTTTCGRTGPNQRSRVLYVGSRFGRKPGGSGSVASLVARPGSR